MNIDFLKLLEEMVPHTGRVIAEDGTLKNFADLFTTDGLGNLALKISLSGGNPTFNNVTINGDLTVKGNFNFGDVGTDVLSIAGYIQGVVTGKKYVAIGNTTTTHGLTGLNDLVVGGNVEIDGTLYLDGNTISAGTLTTGGDLSIYKAINDGNPTMSIGSSAAERITITPVYDAGAQTLDYVSLQTYAASATADKGKWLFGVDGSAAILSIVDAGIIVSGGMTLSGIPSSGALMKITDSTTGAGYANILSFFAPGATSGALMSFGTSATRCSSWTWDNATGIMAYQTYGNAFPFEFQGSWSHFASASTGGSKWFTNSSLAAGVEYMRASNPDRSLGIGTTTITGLLDVVQMTTAPGLVTVNGNLITGTNTKFLNTFKVGDYITVVTTSGSETKIITSVNSNTSLGTDNFVGTATNAAYSLVGGRRFVVKGNGYVGIGTSDLDGTPTAGKLTIKGDSTNGSTLILVGRNGDETNVFSVNTLGGISAASLTLAGMITGITSDLQGTQNISLTISVPSQGATTTSGKGIFLRADDGGTAGTGGNGGNIDLVGGAGKGTSGAGGGVILRGGLGATSSSLGADILTDGELEIWTDVNTLTNWIDGTGGGPPGTETLNQESVTVYSGTYSAKFITDASGNGKYIAQQLDSLTTGDLYRLKYYAKDDDNSGNFNILYLNGALGVATQIWNFVTNAWVNGTGAGGVIDPATDIGSENQDSQSTTTSFIQYTCVSDVAVPTNGTIVVFISANALVNEVKNIYLDKITFQKVTASSGTNGGILFAEGSDVYAQMYALPDLRTPIFGSYTVVGASSDVGIVMGPINEFTYAGSKLVSFRNNLGLNSGTEKFYIDKDGSYQGTGRQLGSQGADVTAANDITLGLGNYFDITGATEIQRILGTGWTVGSKVILQFDGAPLIKHGTAAGSSYYGFKLAGGVDFQASADDTLVLVFDGAWWREIARTVI